MPNPPISISEIAVTAVADGAKQALARPVTDVFFRAYSRVFNANTTLRGEEDVEVFENLRKELKPFCNPETKGMLPSQVLACWDAIFICKESTGPVYTFQVPDVKKCKEQYATCAAIDGRFYKPFPLTGTILGILSAVKLIEVDKKHTVAKIVLGYIALVSLALTEISCPVSQFEVIQLLNNVTNVLVNKRQYRASFDEDALISLTKLNLCFFNFLKRPHPAKEGKIIPVAIERFQSLQLSITMQTFRALLILSEGGNKASLSTDPSHLAKGLIIDGDDKTTFSKTNPYKELLKYAAKMIEILYGTYKYEAIKQHISIPTQQESENYVRYCLANGQIAGLEVPWDREEALLYLLLQKYTGATSTSLKRATQDDEAIIKSSGALLRKIANWLRFHLYAASKIVDINFVVQVDGQAWLAKGEEAEFIKIFVQQYSELLTEFQNDLQTTHTQLASYIRQKSTKEHDILVLLGTSLAQNITELRESGLKPLANIEERLTLLFEELPEIRRRIFAEAGKFLNGSGYGFSLKYSASESKDRKDEAEVSRRAILPAAASIDLVVVEKISEIKKILEDYALGHQYSYTEQSPEFIKMTKEHQKRSIWIRNTLQLINPLAPTPTSLLDISREIFKLRESRDWPDFKASVGKSEIEKCLYKIEGIIHEQRGHNSLVDGFIESKKVPAERAPATLVSPQAFRLEKIDGDGECAFTVLEISRTYAHGLLQTNVAAIAHFFHENIAAELLTDKFCTYLIKCKATEASVIQLREKPQSYSQHLKIVRAYLDYDVRDKNIDKGWAHPNTLRAICSIEQIELYIWISPQEGLIAPNRATYMDFFEYKPEGRVTRRVDMLYVNNNHFNRLHPTKAGERPDYIVRDELNSDLAELELRPSKQGKVPVDLQAPSTFEMEHAPALIPPTTFVTYLDRGIKALESSTSDLKLRKELEGLLQIMAGLNGRVRKFAAVQANEWRRYHEAITLKRLESELHASLAPEAGQASQEHARKFLLHLHPHSQGEVSIHRVQRLPAELTGYKGKYFLKTGDNPKLVYITHDTARPIDTKINSTQGFDDKFGGFSIVTLPISDILMLIHYNQGQNPMIEWIRSKNDLQQQEVLFRAYNKAKSAALSAYFSSNSWLQSQSSAEYKSIVLGVEKLLASVSSPEEFGITTTDFLKAVERHLLLNTSDAEEMQRFTHEAKALDSLLTYIMDAFSSMKIPALNEEEKSRREFYQNVIRFLMVLGANPLIWMRKQKELKYHPPSALNPAVKTTQSRGFILAAELSALILSHLQFRASYLGDTLLLVGEKFKRLTNAVQAFAEHLYRCAGSEEESYIWSKISGILNIPDGARLERANLFWYTLELVYELLDEGLAATTAQSDQPCRHPRFDEKAEKFKSAAKTYVCRILQKEEDEETLEVNSGNLNEIQAKIGTGYVRNLGRATFIELCRAYFEIAEELDRLAKIRQSSKEMFNANARVSVAKHEAQEAKHEAQEAKAIAEESKRLLQEQCEKNKKMMEMLTVSYLSSYAGKKIADVVAKVKSCERDVSEQDIISIANAHFKMTLSVDDIIPPPPFNPTPSVAQNPHSMYSPREANSELNESSSAPLLVNPRRRV
jgi:hypothetical protein